MAWPLTGLMALPVLTIMASCSLACTLPLTYMQGNTTALSLLEQMRRTFAFSCLKHRQDFGLALLDFDGKQVQKIQALSVLHEMTTQTLILFSSHNSHAAWNQSLRRTFCDALRDQMNDLKACLTKETGLEYPSLLHEDSRNAVKKYFRGITDYLKEKSYSPCAWEVVRAEFFRSFSSSKELLRKMQD
uniref:Interferon 1AJ8 n=1 Tax=Cavia porcellus TaxID=10141 RepID=A0A286X7T3_CAVPO|nr:interferon alpha-21-like [Cavia porcellus]CAB0000223.1 TPA: interferon 1AJ8 [Cavia porcellus]